MWFNPTWQLSLTQMYIHFSQYMSLPKTFSKSVMELKYCSHQVKSFLQCYHYSDSLIECCRKITLLPTLSCALLTFQIFCKPLWVGWPAPFYMLSLCWDVCYCDSVLTSKSVDFKGTKCGLPPICFNIQKKPEIITTTLNCKSPSWHAQRGCEWPYCRLNKVCQCQAGLS